MRYTITLNKWIFSIKSLNFNKEITLPHTWNVDEDVMHYRGNALYYIKINLTKELLENKAFINFKAIYHDAKIYVNNNFVGKHIGSGYTPFEFEVTTFLQVGENTIKVEVDNTPCEDCLPYLKYFDWTDDGGIIRSAELSFLPKDGIKFIHIDQKIYNIFNRQCDGQLVIKTSFYDDEKKEVRLRIFDYHTGLCVIDKNFIGVENTIYLNFNNLNIWSPYSPKLYRVALETKNDYKEVRIGLRNIEVVGEKILLNKEEIFLKGAEWMPGSHPDFGMAEPLEHSIKRLKQLKNSGCIFTRFHWQQDSNLYDWCDENGLLVQEEIPYWGWPKEPTEKQLEIAKCQAREMVFYHKNHPSIICWGVGNELNGASSETINYVENMLKYFKNLDSLRLVNYVSNTLGLRENKNLDDATMHGDVAMWNDYFGTWEQTDDLINDVKNTCSKCKGMPLIISEFGLCEPRFKGGDLERTRILSTRLTLYKKIENIKGYVWFSLNDYRTQMGEDGEGRFCQRIHGSTDIYGNEKPSYKVLSNIQNKN